MRLGLSSIVGDGFGTGSFGVDGPLTTPSFPPAGSYNSTQFGIEYPVAEGGTDFANPVTSASVPNQICDVDVLNDGSGGTYTDWSSVTNVQYKANGSIFYTNFGVDNNIEVPTGSGNFYKGGTYDDQFAHDGFGGYTQTAINFSYYSNGTDTNIGSVNGGNQQTEVPSSSGNFYSNGRFDGYTWDGSGGYNFPVTKGAYYSNGTDTNLTGLNVDNLLEVPSGSGNYFSDGTSVGYTWDGSGGYNYPVTKGSFFPNGDDITYVAYQLEVPNGSGTYYNNGLSDRYDWNGSGGYSYYGVVGSYYSYGTFITNYSGTDYYWDGSGGYYY